MVFIIVISLVLALLCPFFGGESFFNLIDFNGAESQIFWQLRIPRATSGFFVGASLGLAGAVFQTVFRNPLASPYTLGIASAGSFGACLAILLGFQNNLLLSSIVFSFLASVLLLAYSGRSNNLLLLGVALGLLFSSASILFSYVADPMKNYQLTRWLMGSLDITNSNNLFFLIIAFIIVVLFCLKNTTEFDLLLVGDELAISKGLDVHKFKRNVVFIFSLLVGIVVSIAGPIGFIGILVPHLCRAFGNKSHFSLLTNVLFLSGGLLVFCDYLARTTVFPAEIPVGVITALIGAPIFILVLLRDNL